MTSGKLNVSRECTPVVDAQYDAENGETPAMAIVDAVAAAEGVDATELPSLYDVIDTDALNKLFTTKNGEVGTEAILSFSVNDWNVFISADGRIRVCDSKQPAEPAPVFDSSAE